MTAPLHGLILSGGQSSRFGSDKAAVELAGEQQLDRLVARILPFVDQVYVSIREDQAEESLRKKYACVGDGALSSGPLSGLLAAHRRIPQAAWLLVPCDIALFQPGTVADLVAGRQPERDATAYADAAGAAEPLCAIYEPATLARFQAQYMSDSVPSRLPGPRAVLAESDVLLLQPDNPADIKSFNTELELSGLISPASATD